MFPQKIVKCNKDSLLTKLIVFDAGNIFYKKIVEYLEYKEIGRVRVCCSTFFQIKNLKTAFSDRELAQKREMLEIIRQGFHNINSHRTFIVQTIFEYYDYNNYDIIQLMQKNSIYPIQILEGLLGMDMVNFKSSSLIIDILLLVNAINNQEVKEKLFKCLILLSENAVSGKNYKCFKLLKEYSFKLISSLKREDYECFKGIYDSMYSNYILYMKHMHDESAGIFRVVFLAFEAYFLNIKNLKSKI